MIPSSACPQRRADQPGNAGQHGDQCRQLHHPMGHHRRERQYRRAGLRDLKALEIVNTCSNLLDFCGSNIRVEAWCG